MSTVKYLLIVIFSILYLNGNGQVISVHPGPSVDSVRYRDITEESQPPQLTCEGKGLGYYRLKFSTEIVFDDVKKDTVKTKKEDWEKEDEEAFDEEYNKKKKAELEDYENEFNEEDEDIETLAKEEIERYIDVKWNRYKYNICKSDCESSLQECYIYQEIIWLMDNKKTYKYRTSSSWVEINDEGDNDVELEFDLVISYETMIYFSVGCSCEDLTGLASATPSRQLSDSNPWAHIDVVGKYMKPFFSISPVSKSFPVIPVIGGVVGGGALIYILTKGEEDNPCGSILGFGINNTSCGDKNGNIGVNVHPPGDYIYTWSNGANSSSINNLAAGTYTLTITQIGTECSETKQFRIIDKTSELESPAVTTTDSDCGLNNGSASILNPSSDVSYTWSNGDSGSIVTGLKGGEYSVTSTRGTCVSEITFSILENNPTFIISGDVERPNCGLSDGSILLSIEPAGNYDYLWDNGETTSTISSLSQGTYGVSITIAGTVCTKTISYTLDDDPADFQLTFTATEATCGVSDGSLHVDVEPPGNYSFLWSNGETTQSISEKESGEYSVTVNLIDTECSVSGGSTIEEKPFPLEIEFISTNSNCGLSDGEIILQLSPIGTYTFEWSNGNTNQNIKDLTAGTYSVTISDQNGCTASGQTQLESEPNIYVENIESSPGDCINEGNITLTLFTPGDGPIVTIITGPNGQETLFLNQGISDLASLIDVLPGAYIIEVYDQNAGVNCNQIVNTEVADNTPNLTALDDNYETESEQLVTGNALENDLGLDIVANNSYDDIGGNSSIASNGDFQFMPSEDFEGEASFKYVIQDACGSLDTATVYIIVNLVECTFTVQFETMAASCGLQDGSAIASVEPPGNYDYSWSDGSVDPNITNVQAGTFELTITDNDKDCFLTFEVTITENNPSYVSNISLVQPSCSIPGDILFELSSSSSGPFLVTVSHPNGIDAYVIPEGPVFMSDYLPIITGSYTISLYDTNAGPECTETFSVIIDEPTELTIALISIIPPSSPTAGDGSVVIEVTSPGIPPYDIWVNGDVWDQTMENEFIINGFSDGEYSIFITDAVGCTSNTVEVFVPPPAASPLNIAVGLISHINSTPENPNSRKINLPLSFVEISGEFNYLGIHSNTNLRLIYTLQKPHVSLSHLVELGSFNLGKISFSLTGGVMADFQKGAPHEPNLISEFSGSFQLVNFLSVHMFISSSTSQSLPLNVGVKLRY